MQKAEGLGERRWLDPPPTVSLVARALGHRDASGFESKLRGERPLPFSDGDRFMRTVRRESDVA